MNVEPGDLAMIVSPSPIAGKVCTVLRADSLEVPAPMVQMWGAFWLVRFPRPLELLGGSTIEAFFPDAHLRRIGGPGIAVNWWTGRGVKARAPA